MDPLKRRAIGWRSLSYKFNALTHPWRDNAYRVPRPLAGQPQSAPSTRPGPSSKNSVSFRVTPERKLTSGYGTLLHPDTAAAAECSHDNATIYPKDATIHSNSPMGSDTGTTGLVAQTHRALAWLCPRNGVDKPVIPHVARSVASERYGERIPQ
jgi:hypothetical protein